jgi:UDP-N-acetyl-D-glucosamine/UDP-N-acetyl-D-galactosamine dehydrogenase
VFLVEKTEGLAARIRVGGILVDVTSALDPSRIPADRYYWSL